MPDDEVFVLTIDFDKESISDCGIYVDKTIGKDFVNHSNTRILSGDKYTSQLNLYSALQPDIYNIKPKGIMQTILLGKI